VAKSEHEQIKKTEGQNGFTVSPNQIKDLVLTQKEVALQAQEQLLQMKNNSTARELNTKKNSVSEHLQSILRALHRLQVNYEIIRFHEQPNMLPITEEAVNQATENIQNEQDEEELTHTKYTS
jgi:hypothetical protein